jgi:hypothetical protein
MNGLERIPQEESYDKRLGEKPEDSNTAIEEEGLTQKIEEIELKPGEFEQYEKEALIRRVRVKKERLSDLMDSQDILSSMRVFCRVLEKNYGEQVKENALYHIISGSTVEDHFEVKDFEGEHSIENFLEGLLNRFDDTK